MEEPLFAGIYEHKGHAYLCLGLARMHHGGEEFVAYVPLRTEPEWTDTARIALRPFDEFQTEFHYVGMRQP